MPSDKRQRQRENSRARQEALIAAQAKAKRRNQGIAVVAIAALVVGALYFFGPLGGSDDENPTAASSPDTTAARATSSTTAPIGDPNTCPPEQGTSRKFRSFPAPPKMCIDPAKVYKALVETDVGDFTITFDAQQSPKTVNNFVFLARNRFYDGTTFHRVIPDFVDQGGSPDGTGGGGPGYQFEDEIPEGYKYKVGDIAMANSGPNSNGSQFFLVVSQNGADQLLAAVGGVAKYSPFGNITDGLDVVKKINEDGSEAGTPTTLHRIVKVTITEE